jgi:hypothetical protein
MSIHHCNVKKKDDPSSVYELIGSFRKTAERFLLFLRNVANIEVLILDDQCIGDEPRTLFTVRADRSPLSHYRMVKDDKLNDSNEKKKNVVALELVKKGTTTNSSSANSATKSGWNAIQDFITGPDPSAPLSKDRFYQRLANTPVCDLPQVEQLVTVTFSEHVLLKVKQNVLDNDEDDSTNSVNNLSTSLSSLSLTSSLKKHEQVDLFMVVACLGGGAAQKMAIDEKNQAMKFIPWGGVAAHLSRDGEPIIASVKQLREEEKKSGNMEGKVCLKIYINKYMISLPVCCFQY